MQCIFSLPSARMKHVITCTVCKSKDMFAHSNSESGFMDRLCLVCQQLSYSFGMMSFPHHSLASGIDRNLKRHKYSRLSALKAINI